ncbi:MAG: hypothetical protein P8Y70_08230 [Candidatus Lokiarchaeota archaeon]
MRPIIYPFLFLNQKRLYFLCHYIGILRHMQYQQRILRQLYTVQDRFLDFGKVQLAEL